MACGSVSVRLPDEVLEQLDKLAQERKLKVSDVVRELILSGLASEKTGASEVLRRIEQLERMIRKAAIAAGKAQFLSSMSVGFCGDMTKLLVSNETPSPEEKTAFLNQTDAWAEAFARENLSEESHEEPDIVI